MQHGHPSAWRQYGLLVIAVICLAPTSSCGARRDSHPPAVSPPTARASAAPKTIATSEVGDPLVITAAVAAIITAQAIVVSDVDLPEQGLLVLGVVPGDLERRDLVTVKGVVDKFDFTHFAARYRLEHPDRYRKFTNRKIVLAHAVRSWS